jgi:hypothetical protein
MTEQTRPDSVEKANEERRAFLAKAGKTALAAPAAALLLAASQAKATPPISGVG